VQAPERNAILHGDCLEIMRSWPDNCIDHCIADPPFGISAGGGRRSKNGLSWAFSSHVTIQEPWDDLDGAEFFEFNVDWLREVCRVVKPNGNILVFGTYHNIYQLGFILQSILKRRILNSIIWYKPNAQPNITTRMLTESTEQIIWAINETPEHAENWTFNYWDAKELNYGKQLRNAWFDVRDIWQVPVASSSERKFGKHPSQKPLEVTSRLVAIATKPGDLVLDPFVGTGAVGVSCIRFMRNYVLIDHDLRFLEATRRRVEEEAERVGTKSREEAFMSLTDSEKHLLQNVPVPQADDLNLVFDVPQFVQDGATSRAAVRRCLDYAARQGPYYADAAIALGLIIDEASLGRSGRILSLTPEGEAYLAAPIASRPLERRRIVLNAPIMKFVSSQLGTSSNGSTIPYPIPPRLLDVDAVAGILEQLALSKATAVRRAHTVVRWLDEI
jgi:site-specific DNA-methyltransferase (adenine-specific)